MARADTWARLVLCAGLLGAGPAAADDDGDNPWAAGPDAPPPDPTEQVGKPPREPGAPDWGLVEPDAPEEGGRPLVPHDLTAARADLRLSTSMTDQELLRFSDLNLADALALVPGMWLHKRQPTSPWPRFRGLAQTHTAIRVDGVPVSATDVFPDFPTLQFIAPDDVQQLTVHHGPRFGLGLDEAGGASIDIRTLEAPQDLGQDAALKGTVRGGFGGADLEKAAFARGQAGYGRARVTLLVGGFHNDQLRGGRPDGVTPDTGLFDNTEALGGHLGAKVDVLAMDGLRLFTTWHSARQARVPLPDACALDAGGGRTDCTILHDRARDSFTAGLDGQLFPFDVPVTIMARAHAQRMSEQWERNGSSLIRAEYSDTTLWRGGGLVDVSTRSPTFDLFGASRFFGGAGAEVLVDRVQSQYSTRSRRGSDGVPNEQFIEDPAFAPIRPRSLRHTARGRLTFGFVHPWITIEDQAELSVTRLESGIVAGSLPRTELTTPHFNHQLTVSVTPFEGVRVFGAAIRLDRPATLAQLARGGEIYEDDPPAAALPGAGRYVSDTLEAGVSLSYLWVEAAGVVYVEDRSGPIIAGFDQREVVLGTPVFRLARKDRQTAFGIEGRARVKTTLDGLSAEGSIGAVAVDDGVFYRVQDPFSPTPASGTPRPAGALAVFYAPSKWPFSTFARVRYAMPLARLSPAEEMNEQLCPEGVLGTDRPCTGVLGHALVDIGATVTPTRLFTVSAVATNVFDAPWRVRQSPLPGGGVAARLVATLRY